MLANFKIPTTAMHLPHHFDDCTAHTLTPEQAQHLKAKHRKPLTIQQARNLMAIAMGLHNSKPAHLVHETGTASFRPAETPASETPSPLARLLRYLRSLTDFYQDEMKAFEYGDHPDADHCRIRLRTVQRIREEIVRLELAPASYLQDLTPEERPAPAPLLTLPADDFTHGSEVRI